MISGHSTNPIFFNKKNKDWIFYFCLIPPSLPHPHHSKWSHMRITRNLIALIKIDQQGKATSSKMSSIASEQSKFPQQFEISNRFKFTLGLI